ncbi:Ig-like domain-containing protein [Helicobacter cinaedi]|uniref:Ig-like domain-containing protein n=1 Tax=Helicobacter cinaedi TaxID=213 RepID=UPI000D7C50E6|nr:Ig-like domain-containing protein [Helicobacter cinaedi]BBB20392.1 hypothetical protein HC081234_15690 [Helicobacter cinaedi]
MSNKENTQEYSKDTLRIQIVDFKDNPIENAEVILLASGQREGQKIALPNKTNSQGETLFNLQGYIKNINRFEITINHPDYYSYPINRNRKICRSYEYGRLCVESFDKIPTFYFNGKMLNISQCPNPTKKYALKNLLNQDSNNQTQKEYYIQLQSNQKSFNIYKDGNLTQESEYILSLETATQTKSNQIQHTQQIRQTQDLQPESALSQSNTNTILSFDSKENLEQFTKDIQEIIIKDKKKGNTKLVHRFIIDYDMPFVFLNKDIGRVNIADLPYSSISQEILTNKLESDKLYIVKSWFNEQVVGMNDVRKISLQTIDIINRKDMSKNPLIYKALDKLIEDYKVYKDNFPQEYYVEFGRYMVESGIQEKTGILYIKILETLIECCELITDSLMFGDKEYKNGGIAIFHLYENYVSKFEGDENGLDKVSHFLFSTLMAFRDNVIVANIASVGNEIVDYLSLNAKKAYNKLFNNKIENYGTGFDKGDIKANNAGISYGAELKERVIKGLFQ